MAEIERETALMWDRQLHKYQAKYNQMAEEMDAEIQRVKQDLAELEQRKADSLEPIQKEIDYFKTNLIAYHEQNVLAGSDKTDKMPYNTLRARKVPQSYKKDDKAVIDWLKYNQLEEFVKTKEQLDWASMKKDVEVHDGKCFMYGILIPVLEAEPESITYSVEV